MGASDYIIEGGSARVTLDPSLYNLEMAYATAYIFLDRAWVLFEGDPKQEIIVRLTPKKRPTNRTRHRLSWHGHSAMRS